MGAVTNAHGFRALLGLEFGVDGGKHSKTKVRAVTERDSSAATSR